MPLHPHRKILVHGLGTGDLTDDEVEQRARELALIEGRELVREEHRAEAWSELAGELLPDPVDSDREGIGTLHRDPSEPVGDPGRHTVNQDGDSDSTAVERLAIEGLEEAQHDQMLAARDRDHRTNRR
jgi:hypothetical protein